MHELTENLLYKLEERVMSLLTDAETKRHETEVMLHDAEAMRQQIQRLQQDVAMLQQENSAMKQEKDGHARKLQDLVSLLDSVNPVESTPMHSGYASVTPLLAQA
jgi:FtsZ-binding cell division protein ZapB